jgi:hypothetical protein
MHRMSFLRLVGRRDVTHEVLEGAVRPLSPPLAPNPGRARAGGKIEVRPLFRPHLMAELVSKEPDG